MADHDIETVKHCVNAYLRHMRHINDDIREVEMAIMDIENKMGLLGVSFDKPGVTASADGDKIGACLARLEELKDELACRINAYYGLYDQARLICQPRFVGRYALWLNKVEGKTWAYVGRMIGYTERHARTVAEGGYRDIYDEMPEEYRRYTIPNAQPL